MEVLQLVGSVTKRNVEVIETPAGAVTRLLFYATSMTSRQSYAFVYSFKSNNKAIYPLEEGDVITLFCQAYRGPPFGNFMPNYQVIRAPLIEVPTGRLAITRTIDWGGRTGALKANQLYDWFYEEYCKKNDLTSSSTDDTGQIVAAELHRYSEEYCRKGIFTKLPPLTDEESSRLLSFWYNSQSLRRLRLLGLTDDEINNSRMRLESLYCKIIMNPFTVGSIDLAKCYEIYERLNRIPENDDIICAEIYRHIWTNTYSRGWTATPVPYLIRKYPALEVLKPRLIEHYEVVFEEIPDASSKKKEMLRLVYLAESYRIENRLTDFFISLLLDDDISDDDPFDTPLPSGKIRRSGNFEKTSSIDLLLVDEQKRAVQGALDHPVVIINGPPGSGKTTVCRKLLENLTLREQRYLTGSFTGKAVSRFRNATGDRTAMTLHRMIANAQSEKAHSFDYVILDEASMITSDLFLSFLEAEGILGETGGPSRKISVVLIGDECQLPPIGAGALFHQLIQSTVIHKYSLNENHRVVKIGEHDGIIANLQNIRDYIPRTGFSFKPAVNFILFDTESPATLLEIVRGISSVTDEHNNMVYTPKNFSLICPYNRPLTDINRGIQLIFQDGKPDFADKRKQYWRQGDKVYMNVNNYDLDIYNGEEGIVQNAYPQLLRVDFGEGRVHPFPLHWSNNYSREKYVETSIMGFSSSDSVVRDDDKSYREQDVRQLRLAYGITIHKSQGSEWDIVIVYLPYGYKPSKFLCRNLIYTAISRAKECVYICGNIENARQAVMTEPAHRCEFLFQRLLYKLPSVSRFQFDAETIQQFTKHQLNEMADIDFDDNDFNW